MKTSSLPTICSCWWLNEALIPGWQAVTAGYCCCAVAVVWPPLGKRIKTSLSFWGLCSSPVGPHRMDDWFQITSSMEGIRSAGSFMGPAGVSGILQPAWIWTVFGSVLGKPESEDCLPEVTLPHPPNLPADPFFFLKRKSLSPQTSPLSAYCIVSIQ